jgi:purine catabolism regulator
LAIKLHLYDKAKGTDYLKVMERLYMNSGNRVKTAEDIFMHRNSLSYKIDKIKQIFEIDELGFSDQLYFLLSCKMLEWQDATQ